MQKNFYTEERLSFARPQAESTMNGTFQWGRKDFNNSTISQQSKTAKSPQRSNLVDARVYTDVQSRGLASRIVKYHENGTRFNRSISMTNLTTKVNSPLSVKKLESKPQLRYDKAIKQNVSMTHIAPPDKSLFYGNTLSGLLRSNSVIALPQNDDDLSSENRPIIHPPVTEKELQPTRSVLEVLKEISRKRINNEVLHDNDEVADNSKKYCGHFVDAAHFSGNDYRLQQMHSQMQTPSQPLQPPPSSYKRQRESTVDGYMPPHCLARDANSFQSKSQQPELPASPEQQSKRRYCNYNNDITSSLSSSAKNLTVKRKLCEYDGYKRQEKVQRYQSEVRLPEISAALNYGGKQPITPLPNTPQTLSKEISIPAALIQKSVSAPLPATSTATSKQKQVVKPKLTLFNRNYETKVNTVEPSEEQAALDSNEDDNAYAGINFVKPKKAATTIGGNSASNLVMERTRKSKLALMLSGLRGELYLGDEEEEQRLKTKTNNEKEKEVPQPLPSIAAPIKLLTTPIDKPDASEPSKQPAVINVANSTASSTPVAVPTSTPPAAKITSPLTGIKLTPQSATTSNKEQPTQVASTFNFGAPSSTATTTTTVAAAKPTFSFGAPATTTNVTTAVSTTATTSLSFGASATTLAPTLPFAAPAISTNSPAGTSLNFNFNSTANSAKTDAATTTTSTTAPKATASASFSFGNNTAANSAAITTTTTASTAPAFSFSGLVTSQSAQKPITTATSTAVPTFSFGAPSSTTATGAALKPNFSFGTGSSTTAASEAPKAPSFSIPPKAVNPAASSAFAFGSNSNFSASENKTAPAASPFGGTANTQATIVSPSFGVQQAAAGAKNAPSATNTFTFGSKPTIQTAAVAPVQPAFGANNMLAQSQESKNTPANTFMFSGTNSNTAQPSFGATNNSFGGNANTRSATTSTTTTTNENTKPSNAFSFSNAGSQPKPFSFGAAANPANAANDAAKSTNLFGAALGNNNQQSKTFSFGSQNVASATNAPPKVASSFSFSNASQSSSSNNNNSNAFLFGASNTNHANINKHVFGAVTSTDPKQNGNNAFSFGQANQTNNTNSNGIFNFNAAAKNTATTSNTTNLGGNNQPSVINKPPTTSNATNTFGSLSSNSGGFVFGANKTSPPTFGATPSTNAQSGGFVFGAAAQQQNSSTTTQLATGNLFAAPNAPTTAPSGNLFGGSANTSATSNIFGSNANSTPAFGAAPATSNGSLAPAANNLFAVPASSGTEQRPIRRATRRLAKP